MSARVVRFCTLSGNYRTLGANKCTVGGDYRTLGANKCTVGGD